MNIKSIFKNNITILFAVLLVVMTIMSMITDYFLTPVYLSNSSRFIAETGLIALGMTVVILTGGIDLSVGSMVALSSIVLGMSCQMVSPVLAVIFGLLTGIAGGFLNGYFITKFKIPALIVTLATLGVFRGVALGISSGNAYPIPESLYFLGQSGIGLIPVQIIITGTAYIIIAFLLKKSNFGANLKAIGYNEETSKFSGININKEKIKAYILSGFFAALLGVLFTCRVSSAKADYGNNYEMDAITVAVFGGAALSGGKVSVLGSFIATIIIVLIRLGLTTAAVQTEIQSVIIGSILIISVTFNKLFGKDRESR